MFAHTTTLWFVACPDPAEQLRRGAVADPERTDDFIARAFADSVPSAIAATDFTALPEAGDDEVFAAHFGDMAVLAGRSLATVNPEELTEFVNALAPGHSVLLLSLDADSSSGTLARWEGGQLVRAFAATPGTIFADQGLPYGFENPFWAGERPLRYQPGATPDPLDLPFHPAELAEEANRLWLGFRFTPPPGEFDTPLVQIPLYAYEILPAGSEAVLAEDAPLREPTPQPEIEIEYAKPSEPTADVTITAPVQRVPSDVEVTGPIIASTTDRVPPETPLGGHQPKVRAPGPISRYFGFRGRL